MWPHWCHRCILQKLFQSQPQHQSTRIGSVRSYPELLRSTFSEPTVRHGVELQIPTKGWLVFARARWLPPDKLAAAKADFAKMEESGIVQRSKSAWSSPLHVYLSRMVPGGPVEIFVASTTSVSPISIRCPTSKIFWASCRAHGSFPKSTWSGVITSFRWPGWTSTKQWSLRHSASTSFWGPHSG